MTKFIIAIDGPAASGKGTLAKMVAEHYAIAYLDTGLTYRAVAKQALAHNIAPEDADKIIKLAEQLDLSTFDTAELSAPRIGQAASKIAVIPELRHILVAKQQEFAKKAQQCVLDGRDIGTIVCPQAKIKFFIDAKSELRAQRRYEQLKESANALSYEAILEDLQKRDARDKARAEGPLKPARDAHLLNTSELSIIEAFNCMINLIDPIWHKNKMHME